MAAKNEKLFLINKKQSFLKSTVNESHEYSNFNLNQNHKCFNESFVHSKNKSSSNNNKNSDKLRGTVTVFKNTVLLFDEKYREEGSLQSIWNISTLIDPKNSFIETEKEKSAKRLNKENSFSNDTNKSSSSTLSLHIVAYENSVEGGDTVSFRGKQDSTNLGKKWKQISGGSTAVIQNSFEFPRQQKDDKPDPAIMQFKASQRLLNPNQSRNTYYDDDYLSEEDEDYCPTANEEAEADAALKELGSSINDQDVAETSKKFKIDPKVDKMWDEFLETSKPEKSVFAPESEDEIDEGEPESGKNDGTSNGKKRKIVETYDFFGENVTREREVDEDEAKKIEERKAKAAEKKPKYVRVQGIEALIKKIDKNPKMTIVEKSHVDWQRHVKKQKLEEDLQKYDRSKKSFLDNAKFAQKAADAEYLLSKRS